MQESYDLNYKHKQTKLTENIDTLHTMPQWWGIFLFIISTILLVLPINELQRFVAGNSDFGLFAWSLMQLGMAIVGYAWGADIIYYHDKKTKDE